MWRDLLTYDPPWWVSLIFVAFLASIPLVGDGLDKWDAHRRQKRRRRVRAEEQAGREARRVHEPPASRARPSLEPAPLRVAPSLPEEPAWWREVEQRPGVSKDEKHTLYYAKVLRAIDQLVFPDKPVTRIDVMFEANPKPRIASFAPAWRRQGPYYTLYPRSYETGSHDPRSLLGTAAHEVRHRVQYEISGVVLYDRENAQSLESFGVCAADAVAAAERRIYHYPGYSELSPRRQAEEFDSFLVEYVAKQHAERRVLDWQALRELIRSSADVTAAPEAAPGLEPEWTMEDHMAYLKRVWAGLEK